MKDKNKIVSIIAPSYNHESYIAECLLSVANQTYLQKELIVIDDCSKDSTFDIINEITKQKQFIDAFPAGITVLQNDKNKGAHYSINTGLSMAKGEYLTVINTDDMYESNRLTEMINSLDDNNSEFAFSKVSTINEKSVVYYNDETKYYKELQKNILMYPSVCLCLILNNVTISTGNMVFTKSLYNKIGGFSNLQYIHDWDFAIKATLITDPVFVETTSYLYRLHPGNTFKGLARNAELCYKETMQVLPFYCKSIINGNYTNDKIPSVDVWEYYIFKILKHSDLIHIWNLSKYYTKRRQKYWKIKR